MKTLAVAVIGAGFAVGVWAAERAVVEYIPGSKAMRDISESSCFPVLGYAGSLENDDCKRFYETDREATAKAFRAAGVRFVRQWNAVDHWQLGAGAHAKWGKGAIATIANPEQTTDMKNVFSFYKEYGIKVILTLENARCYTNVTENSWKRSYDFEDVKRTRLAYVKWIVDNGFEDVVGGFELGNEPYGQPVNKAGEYAARWTPIVNEIKKIMPKAHIGLAIGEYFENDPDVKAIRDRALGSDPLKRSSYFSAAEFNRWSGQYIVAMSNCIHNVDHIIYHNYGAETPYSATYAGLIRYRNFNKAFEKELKGKKMWFTEWRDRSDEDNRSHQRFRETLTKSGYMLMMVSQPDVDCMNLHQLTSLSGALQTAMPDKRHPDEGTWVCQWDDISSWRSNWDWTGKSYLRPGMMGPAMRLIVETLRRNPLIMDLGSVKYGQYTKGGTNVVWASSDYYNEVFHRFRKDVWKGIPLKDIPKAGHDCQYLVCTRRHAADFSIIAVNYQCEDQELEIKLPQGYWPCNPEYRVYQCPEEFLDAHEIAGEPPFTKCYAYQPGRVDPKFSRPVGPLVLKIPANSVTAVRVPMRWYAPGKDLKNILAEAQIFTEKGGVSVVFEQDGKQVASATAGKFLDEEKAKAAAETLEWETVKHVRKQDVVTKWKLVIACDFAEQDVVKRMRERIFESCRYQGK